MMVPGQTLYPHSPFSGLRKLANLALDRFTLQGAEMLDEEDSIQVIGLVAEGARQQAFTGHGEPLTVHVLGLDGCSQGAAGFGAKLGQTEAAFLARLPALD